jgi:hypothetical protein
MDEFEARDDVQDLDINLVKFEAMVCYSVFNNAH